MLFSVTVARGYELATHEALSVQAVRTSVIGSGVLEEQLDFSKDSLLFGPRNGRLKPEEWIRLGSRQEDALLAIPPVRVVHHFHDPVYDRPLSGSIGDRLFFRAPDWALEDPSPILGQEFSWRDARRAFRDALTAPFPLSREHELARTFLTLGHVIHLIQDMAVPEHTRNDWHAGIPVLPTGTPSLFERGVDSGLGRLPMTGYPPPRFDHSRHFWATGDGRGLAEFTNRNFVSKDTVFETLEEGAVGRDRRTGHVYPSPRLQLALREDVDVTMLPDPPRGLSGPMT
ncbi:MAG TPA: hypothetical protein VNO23_18865, partial [Candidatus Binatia bacterium]|nr:hypothetical protein [Candidatus Binatia bacterium]